MKKWHERLPSGAEDGNERWRGDQLRTPAPWSNDGWVIARRCPQEQVPSENEVRSSAEQDKRAVGQVIQLRIVKEAIGAVCDDALRMELGVDGVRTYVVRVQRTPDPDEANVILPTTQRAGAVAGRHRRRLVEEEELREAARLHERAASQATELELARDPAFAVVPPADATVRVV